MDERLKNSWILPWRSIRKKIFSARLIYPVTEEMKMTQNMRGIWRSWPIFYGSISNEPVDITESCLCV